MYNYVALLLIILANPTFGQLEAPTDESEAWDVIFAEDVTPNTYFSLKNLSLTKYDDYKLDYKKTDTLYRRQIYKEVEPQYPLKPHPVPENADWYWVSDKEVYEKPMIQAVKTLSIIYQLAYREIREFYPLRYLYLGNLEFEVGYLVYQAIHRYQMMIELYEIVYRKFYLNQTMHNCPPKYMMFIYRRMVRLSWVIIHLSNMAHELEIKYKGHVSIFTITTLPPPTVRGKHSKDIEKAAAQAEAIIIAEHGQIDAERQKMEVERIKQKKKLQKQRKKQEKMGEIHKYQTVYPSHPMNKWRPYVYGWSVEDWL